MEEHFSLARGNQSPTTFSSANQREKNTDLRFLFAESERFLSQDINLLLGASDRETTLENYLIDGENILSSSMRNQPLLQLGIPAKLSSIKQTHSIAPQ